MQANAKVRPHPPPVSCDTLVCPSLTTKLSMVGVKLTSVLIEAEKFPHLMSMCEGIKIIQGSFHLPHPGCKLHPGFRGQLTEVEINSRFPGGLSWGQKGKVRFKQINCSVVKVPLLHFTSQLRIDLARLTRRRTGEPGGASLLLARFNVIAAFSPSQKCVWCQRGCDWDSAQAACGYSKITHFTRSLQALNVRVFEKQFSSSISGDNLHV